MNADHRIKSETVYMISASMVAIIALIVSVWQGYETRRHNRLSVKPFLTFTKNFNPSNTDDPNVPSYQLTIKNSGTGPAIIKSFTLSYQNKVIEKSTDFNLWQSVLNQAAEKDLKIYQAASYDSGDVIEIGLSKSIIKINYSEPSLRKVKLRIVYQSIYEEEFEIETNLMN